MAGYRCGTSLIETVHDARGEPDSYVYEVWRGTCRDDEEREQFTVCAFCDQLVDDGCDCTRCAWCGCCIVGTVAIIDGDEEWHPGCVGDAARRERVKEGDHAGA